MKNVKVASIQCSSVIANTSKNIEKQIKLIREAAKNGAKIILLPEASLTAYISQDYKTAYRLPERPLEKTFEEFVDPTSHSLSIDGPEIQNLCSLSKELEVYITLPFIERESDEEMEKRKKNEKRKERRSNDDELKNNKYRYYNTIALSSPEGKIVAHYRKLRPWMYYEKSWVTPGKEIATYETEYGKIGLIVCCDIRESIHFYKDEKLWSILHCVAWSEEDLTKPVWLEESAVEHLKKNNVDYNVLSCNWSLDKDQAHFGGHGFTTMYDKEQKILAKAKTKLGTEFVYSEVPYD